MSRLSLLSPDFLEFEKRVVDPIHAYWLDHSEPALQQSADLLAALAAHTDPDRRAPLQLVVVNGWLSKQFGYRMKRGHLEKLNPGYDVRIRRIPRPDAPTGRAHGRKLGFELTALGDRTLPTFFFSVQDETGRDVALTGSSSESRFKLDHFVPSSVRSATPQHDPVGYVDDVLNLGVSAEDRDLTWMSAIIHRNPREVMELVDSPVGHRLAGFVARLYEGWPAAARWGDRFSLVANGLAGPFSSDLRPVGVLATDVAPAEPATVAMPVPRLERSGSVVRFAPGEAVARIPSPEWVHLDDAVVQNGGTVIADGNFVAYEASAHPSLDVVSGQSDTVFGSRMHPEAALVEMRPIAQETVPEGVLISGRNDFNWFHWFIEYLPRVLMIEPGVADDVPVLVTTRVPKTGIAALRSLTRRPIVELDAETAHRVGRLHVVAPQMQILDSTRLPWSDGLSVNVDSLRAVRSALGLDGAVARDGRAVFLQRKSGHRGMSNETDIAAIAVKHGLEVLDPGAMTWDEQKALFSSASLLVGASGAVMANYLLMSPGSRVLALTSEALEDFVLPAAIAATAGVEFTYVTGESTTELADHDHRIGWMHSDFRISEEAFEEALLAELAIVRSASA